jgi:pilus assembly protein CpaD
MDMSLTKALIQSVACLALVAVGSTPALARKPLVPTNRGLEPAHQPVVQRTDFVFDTVPDGYGTLSRDEKLRIRDWFDAIELGYGDRVYVLGDSLGERGKLSGAIGDLVADYGLLLADRTPATLEPGPSGSIRIAVSRFVATVPGCPDWRDHSDADIQGGLSYDYGCSINGNLAAMVANPEDLIHGRAHGADRQNTVRDRAIKAYRNGPIK